MLNVHTRELGGHMKDVLFRPITFEKYRKPQVVEYPRHAIVLNPHHTRQQQQQQQQQKHLQENDDDNINNINNDDENSNSHPSNARRFLISEMRHRNQSLSYGEEEEDNVQANKNNVDQYNSHVKDNEEEDDVTDEEQEEEEEDEEEEGNPYHFDENDKLCTNDAFLAIVQTCGKWQTIRPVGRGLVNLGNTCFANSILQCFSYVPMLAQYLCNTYRASDNQLGAPYDFAFALAETIREIHGIRGTTPSPMQSSLSPQSLSRYAVGNGRQSVILSSSIQNSNTKNINGRNTFISTTPTSTSSPSPPAANNQLQQYNYQNTSSNSYNNLHYHHSNGNAYRPGKIIGFLKTLSPRFTPGRQCDAHEFAMQLLSTCQKSILFRHVGNRKLPQLVAQSTSLYRICAGYLRSQVSWSLEEEVAQLIKSDRKQVAMDLQMEQASAKLQKHSSQITHTIRKTTNNNNSTNSNNGDNVKQEEVQMLHSNTYELFTILSVDLAGKTLSQCLDRFFAPEQLHGRCYLTPREIPVYAHKEYKLHLPPAVLMLQLKRFDASGRKVSKMVEYPLELDLTYYCTPAAIRIAHKEQQHRENNKCTKNKKINNTSSNNSRFNMNHTYNNYMPSNYCSNNGWHHSQETENFPTQIRLSEVNKLRKVQQQQQHRPFVSLANNNIKPEEEQELWEEEEVKKQNGISVRDKNLYRYELSAVCVHEGNSLHFGHYYAVVKAANGMWYVCNDIQVNTISEDRALHMQAYMLFYSRIMPETISETTATIGSALDCKSNNNCAKITKTTNLTSTLSLPISNDNDCTTNNMSNNSLFRLNKTNNISNNNNNINSVNNNQNLPLHRALSDNHIGTNVSETNELTCNNFNSTNMNNYVDSDAMLGRALTAEEEVAAVSARIHQNKNKNKAKDDKLATPNHNSIINANYNNKKITDALSKKTTSETSSLQTVNNSEANVTKTENKNNNNENTNHHFLRDKLAMKRFREEVETESDSDEQLNTNEDNNTNNKNNDDEEDSDRINEENDKTSKTVIVREKHPRLARTGRDAIHALEHTRHNLAPSSTQRPARAPQFQQRIRDPMWEMAMDRGRVKKVKSKRIADDNNIDSNVVSSNTQAQGTNQFQKVAENRFDSRGRPLQRPLVKEQQKRIS